MSNSPNMQKKIRYASIKLSKSNFYHHLQRSSLPYEASHISSIAPLGSEVPTAMFCITVRQLSLQ